MILEKVCEGLVRRLLTDTTINFPKVRGEVFEGVGHSVEGSEHKVSLRGCATTGGCVAVGDTGEGKHLLGDSTSNQTSTTRGRDQAESDGTALSGNLDGNGVRSSEGGTPVSETDRDNRQLGDADGSTDGGGNLARAFDTKTDMSLHVTDKDEGLEAGTLTGASHLLDRADFDNIIFEVWAEGIDDGGFLDREGEEVDFGKGLDLSTLNQTSELGERDPFLLLITAASTASTATTSTASSSMTSTATKTASFC